MENKSKNTEDQLSSISSNILNKKNYSFGTEINFNKFQEDNGINDNLSQYSFFDSPKILINSVN